MPQQRGDLSCCSLFTQLLSFWSCLVIWCVHSFLCSKISSSEGSMLMLKPLICNNKISWQMYVNTRNHVWKMLTGNKHNNRIKWSKESRAKLSFLFCCHKKLNNVFFPINSSLFMSLLRGCRAWLSLFCNVQEFTVFLHNTACRTFGW